MPDESWKTDVETAVALAHRRLEELFRGVTEAFDEPRDIETTRDSFAALRRELDVHFDQEDSLYYATIGSLRPHLKRRLQSFAEGHRGFRLDLEVIAGHLERGDGEAAARAFADLVSEFMHHEQAEESLLRSLDPDDARPD